MKQTTSDRLRCCDRYEGGRLHRSGRPIFTVVRDCSPRKVGAGNNSTISDALNLAQFIHGPEVGRLRETGSHVIGGYSYPTDMFSLGNTIQAVLNDLAEHEFFPVRSYDVGPDKEAPDAHSCNPKLCSALLFLLVKIREMEWGTKRSRDTKITTQGILTLFLSFIYKYLPLSGSILRALS